MNRVLAFKCWWKTNGDLHLWDGINRECNGSWIVFSINSRVIREIDEFGEECESITEFIMLSSVSASGIGCSNSQSESCEYTECDGGGELEVGEEEEDIILLFKKKKVVKKNNNFF